jgi:hypothetical protein
MNVKNVKNVPICQFVNYKYRKLLNYYRMKNSNESRIRNQGNHTKKIIPVPNLLSGVQTMWKKNNVER